jgi:hypothetical protein
MDHAREFEQRVAAVIGRFFAQNESAAPSAAELGRFAAQLRQLVVERGLPRPLGDDECGAPGGMAEEECAPLVARVVDGLTHPLFADAARQLVKACFYPEFKICRDSFREVARDGSCRRQELARVRGRISGTHCVDCPHWVAFPTDDHERFLRREWHGDTTLFAEYRHVFLPEDFRELRRWLHAAARRAGGPFG